MTLKNRHLVLLCILMTIAPFLRGQDHLVINDPDRPLIYFSNLDNVFHRTISNELLGKIDERDQKVLEINSKEKVLNRMKRNYLKGVQGDVINAVMAGAAFNFKRWLNQKLKDVSGFIQNLLSGYKKISMPNYYQSVSC